MIVGIHHVAIGVDDLAKAEKFYTEGLGFEVVARTELNDSPPANRAIGLRRLLQKW